MTKTSDQIAADASRNAEQLVKDVAASVARGRDASPAVAGTILGLQPSQIVSLVGMIAGAVVPGASVAGISIKALTGLAVGVAEQVPAALKAVQEIREMADSGGTPTEAQWAHWNAAADQAHIRAQAAADKVINGPGP